MRMLKTFNRSSWVSMRKEREWIRGSIERNNVWAFPRIDERHQSKDRKSNRSRTDSLKDLHTL